jgi:carbamate kinase
MGPKVESVLRFLDGGGKESVITSYDHLCAAIDGTAGTCIVPDLSSPVLEATHTVARIGGH